MSILSKSLSDILQGYQSFRDKYVLETHTMQNLAADGQKPEVMVVACCDSRVDPALLFQCDPGDLFVVRNVANIVPPNEIDDAHHGTSAALEFGICYLNVKHLIILGHSQCGGINALQNEKDLHQNDFISNWVSLVKSSKHFASIDDCAKFALTKSYQNCLSFPWIKRKLAANELSIHLWFFDIKQGQIFAYDLQEGKYLPL